MKVVFRHADLQEGVSIALKAVPSRTTMPILECILIDASFDSIRLVANDMELGIETRVNGEILERGKIALDAKIFSDIVRKLPDSDVTIVTDDRDVAVITCEKAKFSIPGKPGDDFAELPAIESTDSIVISQYSLREMIRQTIFSIAPNENNRLMTGELFEIRNNMLRVVALDGHRISIRNMELQDACRDTKVVVPGKTLSEVSKILSGEIDEMATVFFAENHMLFEFGHTKVLTRLIEGEYFRIDQMLSSDYETKIVINRLQFMNCIDRATLLVRESDKMPVIFDISDDSLELRIDTQLGSMNESMPVEKTGRDLVIGFNPKLLLDALRVTEDEEVSLYFVNAKAPCFIRDDRQSYIYLILPVNIR